MSFPTRSPRPVPGVHLGAHTSALLDGHLDPTSAAAAWAHVDTCEDCRARVESERWVKERLGGLGDAGPGPRLSADLKGSILAAAAAAAPSAARPVAGLVPGVPVDLGGLPALDGGRDHAAFGHASPPRPRGGLGLLGLGGSAAGAAVLGVLALGVVPANAPATPRQTSVVTPASRPLPAAAPGTGTPAAPGSARTPGTSTVVGLSGTTPATSTPPAGRTEAVSARSDDGGPQ